MHGWTGRLLRVNLTKAKGSAVSYGAIMAKMFLGGRGFAVKILWDELEPWIDPLGPDNKLVFATGPLTGFSLPSSGKMVVASKSPLTGGYGDGNIGTQAAVQIRRAGYDAIIIEGKSREPIVLLVRDDAVEFLDGKELWGLDSFATEKKLKEDYGHAAGILCIGPAGENLVRFATIISQEGRSGGRPGIGAVMGSKMLKAVVFLGSHDLPAAFPKELQKLGAEAYRETVMKPNYAFWKRQGTMATIDWSQENGVLPTRNYSEGIFEKAKELSGFAMEKIKISNRGCPQCNMTCGNIVKDSVRGESEVDYENVAMLGSNIGLGNLKQVAVLNRFADELGMDTISLGNVLGFTMEASEKGIIKDGVSWGTFKETKELVKDIAFRNDLGDVLANGVRYASDRFGGESHNWAMHVKGLEISAYDCHTTPAMALAYATSSIGAHHKDAWVISWEVQVGRDSYSSEKVDKLIDLQRLRAGVFESLTVCRFPWIEVGLEPEWYLRFLHASTGLDFSWNMLYIIADRIFNLSRAFWVREFRKNWGSDMDVPPLRWFKEPLTQGQFKGARLDKSKYDIMLESYYSHRGWDSNGVPTKTVLKSLGMEDIVKELGKHVRLSG